MLFLPFIFFYSNHSVFAQGGPGGGNGPGGGGNGPGGGGHEPPTETAGNNLSFPVIFADGGTKVLPGTMEAYSLQGVWWYVWGEDPVDPQAPLYSCQPLDTDESLCSDGSVPGDGISTLFKAYIQKDPDNVWQAYNTSVPPGETLNIDWVDWGDDLESIAWKINSKVRTEVVLLEDIDSVTEFAMRHVDSWGIDEVHGAQTTLNNEPIYGPGTQATVYTPNGRLTVQKLNFNKSSIDPSRLTWIPGTGWTETNPEDPNIINEAIFDQAVSEAGTGPEYFNAEINVKGKIMFGYTWDVSSLNEGEGYYRMTFSFDEGDEALGTAKFNEFTQIIVAEEEEETVSVAEEGGPGSGGVPVMDPSNNLTYIDILVGDFVGDDLPWVAVTGLELIDAENDVSLGTLTDGMQINMSEFPVSNLSIEALVTDDVGSVQFQLSGESTASRVENTAPYTLYGQTNGDYNGHNFTEGTYTLVVTPYASDDLSGEAGTPVTVSFEVSAAPEPTAGNNLSFPVIFADGGSKVLPGTMGEYTLQGEWWYVWGEDPIDPQAPLYSCKPLDTDESLCMDGSTPGDGVSELYKAYIQKDFQNIWQAYNTSVPDGEVLGIDWIDWGDNLESVAWELNSKVRTELVLLEDIDSVAQFAMRHVNSWGTDEVHGAQTTLDGDVVYGPGTQATVYSPNGRLTIQKMNYKSGSFYPGRLTWQPEIGWTETDPEDVNIINEPIFNLAASEAGTGPGYFSAEINVKGKIIYGYTWDINQMNEGEGHYRLTFSFDAGDGISGTAGFDEFTQIIVPIEEEAVAEEEGPGEGGVAILDLENNITYMDVLVGNAGPVLSVAKNQIESFKLYPNPVTNGVVYIQSSSGYLVDVYNIIGQKVISTTFEPSNKIKKLNLSALQSGLYLLQLSDGEKVSVKKLIVR
ncbi:hypothetical protein GCM10022260_13650 [Gaetbulibacter aestuarii]